MSISLLIDEFLAEWDVAGEHTIVVRATPSQVYEGIRALDLGRSWGVRQLFRLRGLPPHALTLPGLQRIRFALLADVPPRELVLGIIGRFWTASGKLRQTHAADFRSFAEPGFAKSVWNFSVHEDTPGTVVLRTETRVLCLDDESRKSFRRYWTVISPFSGWIRREALKIIKERAERGVALEVSA